MAQGHIEIVIKKLNLKKEKEKNEGKIVQKNETIKINSGIQKIK